MTRRVDEYIGKEGSVGSLVDGIGERGLVVGGMEFCDGVDEFHACLWWFGWGECGEAERYVYLKRCIDLKFNCVGSVRRFVWNEWSERMMSGALVGWDRKKVFNGWAGSSSCVAGDTRMLNPIDGSEPTIRELCEKEERPWVMTLHGPVLADVPYLKGEAELYRFMLSNGGEIRATAEHRFLSESGWIHAKDANEGDWLLGYERVLPSTILDNYQTVHGVDGLRLTEKVQGSRCGYPVYSCCDDEQLRLARGSALDGFPLQDDARKHDECASVRLDVPYGGSGHSHLYQSSGLSKRSVFLQGKETLGIPLLYHSSEGTSSLLLPSFQLCGQYPQENDPNCTILKQDPCFDHMPYRGCVFSRLMGLEYSISLGSIGRFSSEHEVGQQQVLCFSSQGTDSLSGIPIPAFDRDRVFVSGFWFSEVSCLLLLRSLQIQPKRLLDSVTQDNGLGLSYPSLVSVCNSWCLKVSRVQVVSKVICGVERFYDLNVPVHHHYFAEGVISHNSGKSDCAALFGLMMYWARPNVTYVFVLSTTKSGARLRVWKSLVSFWRQAVKGGIPGKLNDSIGKIKGVDQDGVLWNNSGIELLAAGVSDADEACDTLLGAKNTVVVVLADEHTDLGPGVLKTASENLTSNDRLHYIGMGNPNLLSDPFADLCEPVGGWKSVNEGMDEWKTKYGICLRFDGERSPRILEEDTFTEEEKAAGKVGKCFWQPDREYIDRIAESRGGRKSKGYYRFVKAFWCPEGAANTIYSEVEFLNSCALDVDEPKWDSPPVALSGLDPSFSRGGDRNQSAIAKVGKVEGRTHLHFCQYNVLTEDLTDKKTALTHQIARQWKDLSEDWGVKPHRAVMDNTGSGISFGHVVDMEWSPAVSKVNFKSKPSGRTVVFRSEVCEYYNKNAELWIQMKEFIRSNQISGICKEAMAELVTREFHEREGRALRVQEKDEHKKNNGGVSPDLADVVLLIVDKAISDGLLVSEEVKVVSKTINSGWKKTIGKVQIATTCGRRMRFR